MRRSNEIRAKKYFEMFKAESQGTGQIAKGQDIGKRPAGQTFIRLPCSECGSNFEWISASIARKNNYGRRCLPCAMKNRAPCAEETKRKISKANKGRKGSKEFKEFCSELMKIRWGDTSYRKHMGEAHKGNPGYWTGKQLSEGHKCKLSESHKGYVWSPKARMQLSESISGENHWNWKGGRSRNGEYILVYDPTNPMARKDKHVLEHRKIIAEAIGRSLKFEERVHHIDGDPQNNDLDNLMLFPNHAVHMRFHAKLTMEPRKNGKAET